MVVLDMSAVRRRASGTLCSDLIIKPSAGVALLAAAMAAKKVLEDERSRLREIEKLVRPGAWPPRVLTCHVCTGCVRAAQAKVRGDALDELTDWRRSAEVAARCDAGVHRSVVALPQTNDCRRMRAALHAQRAGSVLEYTLSQLRFAATAVAAAFFGEYSDSV